MSKLALLIPTYNSSNTIKETLNSIQGQLDESNLSFVLISDDCSTDNTIDIVKSSWQHKTPIEFIEHKENIGQWSNMNFAIRSVKDRVDWILILHSDDIARDEWLGNILRSINNCDDEQVVTIFPNRDYLYSDGTVETGSELILFKDRNVLTGTEDLLVNVIKYGCFWYITGCAIRISSFELLGDFDEKIQYAGDKDWLIRLLRNKMKIQYIPQNLIMYRRHDDAVSFNTLSNNIDFIENFYLINKYIKYLNVKDLIYLHLRYLVFVSKRFVKSILSFNIQKSLLHVKFIFQVIINLIKVICKKFL